MRLATALALLLFAAPALAQTPGNCAPASAEADLDIADTRARVFNGGSLFFGNTTVAGDGYFVPKFSGNSTIFAAGIWIGGTIGGDRRLAGSTYGPFEFWPGPLNEGATLPDPDDCSAYDRIWVVSVLDVERYDDEGIATTDLAEWPVELGAPVIDGDGVAGNYNLEGGDRPEVLGHQTAFWVMNDVGNTHDRFLSQPIGLEVRVTAFASAEEPFQRHTFYRYEVINRNSQPFEAARFGLFADPDLGDAADDYHGVDTTRSLAFTYNADDEDANYGIPPAFGTLFLGGLSAFSDPSPVTPFDPPLAALGADNLLNGRWRDGTPITEGGNGYFTDGEVLTTLYPGDPVTGQFWSEVNPDDDGDSNPPGDRRNVVATEAFTLAPGETRIFDFAILFAQGEDRFDSLAELHASSDGVQARYEAGDLFVPSPVPLPPAGALPTPDLLAPADGATFVDEPAVLRWIGVAGADGYRVEINTNPDFVSPEVYYSETPDFTYGGNVTNELLDYYWRVQAGAGLDRSEYSDVRSFTLFRYGFDDFGDGVGIIETAHPEAEVCPSNSDDPGCTAGYPGNTVWHDANATDDYVLTNPDNDFADLLQYASVIDSDLEIRFTEACAEPGACLGVYPSAVPGGTDLIVSIPFELWNAGLQADPDDDVRMIPFLRATEDTAPANEWADSFPASQEVVAGEDTLMLPVTQRVLGMMPDRPNGYALFAGAAASFGGPGATYNPEADGDTQVDSLSNGIECRRQHYYTDFCYRDASDIFVAPLGGLDGVVLADLAGDGTTPPVGTTIRFDAPERLLEVSAEDDAPTAQPQALTLDAAYPNPFRSSATVAYQLEQPADVQLAVYDVLGRRVAVLAEGPMAAGTHRARFDGAGLASGVYLVVLEADGQRQSQKVLLLR